MRDVVCKYVDLPALISEKYCSAGARSSERYLLLYDQCVVYLRCYETEKSALFKATKPSVDRINDA